MTIYSGNLDLEGDRPTDSFDTSLSDVFENSLSHNVFGGVRGAADIGELREANAPTLDQATAAMNAGDKEAEMELRGPAHGVGTLHDFGTGQSAAPPPEIPMADAKQQVKGAGLERELMLPDQPTIRQNVLGIMMQRARDRAETASILSRAPTGAGALDFGTSMIAQSLDPINIAAAFIPIVGEARYAKLMESAGESFLARAGVRTGVGFAQGAVFSAATQPIEYYAATQEGRDYGMSDALRSVMMGGATFGAMHLLGGAGADLYRRTRGIPLFPFGPGEPMENVSGTHVPAAALAEEGITAAEVAHHPPMATESPNVPDMAARVDEDLLRGSIAQMVQEKPVVAVDHLLAGAQEDPRIAATLADHIDAYHSSPHDFERFDINKIGTGEGAQTYGHGFYFGENPKTAEFYRDYLTNDIHGPIFSDRAPTAMKAQFDALFREHVELENRRLVTDQFSPEGREIFKLMVEKGDELDNLAERSRKEFPPGTLYKVRIKANHEHMLDWDKPLNEQSEHVQSALKRVMGGHSWDQFQNADGGTAVKNGFIAFDPREGASRKLADAGIPGIKYLDRGSRPKIDNPSIQRDGDKFSVHDQWGAFMGAFDTLEQAKAHAQQAQQQTRNFVVFNDKDIEITHKNGEAVKRIISDAGIDPKSMTPEISARLADAVERGTVTDPLAAVERAANEETYHGKARGEAESLPEANIPRAERSAGEPVSTDAGPAPAGGRGIEGEPQPGAAGAGPGPRPISAGDRAADVRELASRPGPTEQPGAVAAFKAAERLPEMPAPDSPKSAQLAEAQAVQAEAMWNEAAKYLPPEQRRAFEDAFAASERDSADRAAIIQQGAACLMAAVV